jgi:O-antigen ligase
VHRRKTTSSNASSDACGPRWQWLLLLSIVVFEYVRPMDWVLSFLGPLRLPGLATLVIALIFVFGKKDFLKQENLHKLVIAFWLLVSVTVFYSPNNRAAFNTSTTLLWNIAGFIFPLSIIVCSKERVYRFFGFWIAVQTILAILVIKDGGHGPGSYLWDENEVALALNMAIPYAVFISRFPGLPGKWRLALYGCIGVLLAAIGISASRGGVVGLAALILIMVWISDRPIRNGVLVAVVGTIAFTLLVKMLPADYRQDMADMSDPKDNTRDERLWSWSVGWVMYLENPVLGVGANNYAWTNHLYARKSPMYHPKRKIMGGRQAHSLYFTLLPELGSVGLIIYFALVKGLYNRYRTVREYCKVQTNEDAEKFGLLFKAMLASCFAFLVTGAFISVLYYPPFWHLVGMVAATYRVAGRELPNFPSRVVK